MNRRSFLKTAAAAVPVILAPKTLGFQAAAPSERVRVGLIGLGGRCRDIAATCLKIPELQIAAVCDCFKPRVDELMRDVGEKEGWIPYTDFREMIEKEKLDGVMVETTTHARAWVACSAMAMGMDTYIEKPMCLTIAEGREMVNRARKYERITQVGTQQRSIPLNNWASDLVKNGSLGKIKVVRAPNFVGPVLWEDKEGQPMPEGGSENWWDIWTNQAVMRPYHEDIRRAWSKWWDYDGGGLCFGVTGWGTHSYDQINRGIGMDETGPTEVILQEAVADRPAGNFTTDRVPGPNETGAGYYGMTKDVVGPRAKVLMRYANGIELHLDLDADFSPGLGAIFECEKGTVEINRDMISASAPELIESPDRPAAQTVPETQPHIENWVKGIKTRVRCTADIEFGQRSSSLCYLVNIAREVGKVGETLQWDPAAERFTNCDEGNALLTRPRRERYELPA
ncbi:MAG: Gfo/Idh/MocA family oxidoreductase [Candidatus Hydrogenedentes bacterium]|nr:Gfo/Idh/MocA family oxidoreductase [Candidatus Hydrogenedentota bacterium]